MAREKEKKESEKERECGKLERRKNVEKKNERQTSSRVFFRPSLNDSSRKKGSGQGEGGGWRDKG